jgi:hypothetical protein
MLVVLIVILAALAALAAVGWPRRRRFASRLGQLAMRSPRVRRAALSKMSDAIESDPDRVEELMRSSGASHEQIQAARRLATLPAEQRERVLAGEELAERGVGRGVSRDAARAKRVAADRRRKKQARRQRRR